MRKSGFYRWRVALFGSGLFLACFSTVVYTAEHVETTAVGGADLALLVPNHHVTTPWLITGGAPAAGEMAALKQAGVANIIDLRRPREGVAAARKAAEAVGLRYLNLPLGAERPGAALIDAFAAAVARFQGEPTLLHCATGNRAGTVWAMYRVREGVPARQAIEEGIAAGMAASRSEWIQAWERALQDE